MYLYMFNSNLYSNPSKKKRSFLGILSPNQ
nr:MAG TPA: hypothetical protein [Caudoviricetes sp.]